VSRPTKLTANRQELIVSAIRIGNYARVAAEAAGIDESTLYRWMKRGAEDELPPFARSSSGCFAKPPVRRVSGLDRPGRALNYCASTFSVSPGMS
jgi:hypothetical protein